MKLGRRGVWKVLIIGLLMGVYLANLSFTTERAFQAAEPLREG